MEYLGKTDFVHIQPTAENLALNRNSSGAETEHLPNKGIEQMDLPLESAVLPKSGHSRLTVNEHLPDPLNAQLSRMMGDAPMCSTCGHVTVRNGSCYRCLNCGNSMGCS
jgi:ribonucleoside-diphosphate reductase alpha chain